MKKFLSLASVMAITGCLLSCNDVLVDDYAPSQSTPIAFSASIKQDYTTRINDEGFVGGDRMGVFVVDYVEGQPGTLQVEKNRADNVAFTYDATTNVWTGESDVYWKDKHSAVDVFGYYPYQRSVVNVDASLFEVAADQSIPASDGEMSSYEASDFLWAKAAGVTPDVSVIRLAYQHRMAGIFVSLVEGEGFSDGQWETLDKQVLVCNTRRTAEINLSTGVATPIGELDKHIVPSVSGDNYRAVVVPQSVEAGKALLSITIDGTNYFYTKPEAITYLPGRLHQFTMQVDKRSESGDYTFTLLTEEITPWQNDEASHSFETSTYVVVHVPTAGTLQQCIESTGHNYLTLQNLKLTGFIDAVDFTFMRDKMTALKALNLKEVRLPNDKIPTDALKNKKMNALVLPDQCVIIGSSAFYNSGLTGSCIIPEGVKIIGSAAFSGNPFTGELVLPTTLEEVGIGAFYGCAFNCELKLPARLKSIGSNAFKRLTGQFQGELILPENLTYVGEYAFLSNDDTRFKNKDFEIPKSMTKIERDAFYVTVTADGRLILHEGITEIGEFAFSASTATGVLHLPTSLRVIGEHAFTGGDYTEIYIPENVVFIGSFAFLSCSEITKIALPSSLRTIETATFERCSKLQEVYIPKNIEYIGGRAFGACEAITTITCMATTPPILESNTFESIVLNNAQLIVPESAIDAYRNAEGWKEFASLTPQIEIESNVSVVKVSNSGISEKEIILKTSGAWVVENIPDWCHLSQTTGENRKTLLQLTIPSQSAGSGNRMGEIVLRLRDKEQHRTTIQVEQYDVTEAEEINLQTATRGPGIQFFLLGDGFDAQEVYEGRYLEAMHQQMENFFDIEPYRTYRDYFTVNTALVVSPESGISSPATVRSTRFNTKFAYSFFSDYDAVRNYVVEVASGIEFNTLQDALVVLVANSSEFGGHTELWSDGSFLSVCPLSTQAAPRDARGIIQHEAGGHGFAKLGDEDVEHYDFITACWCPKCNELWRFNEGKERGWYANLSLSDKMSDLPWQHLIFDSRFSQQVDIFEGGFDHARAMYRSEESSIMRNYESYFNAISRETIVRRIMELAGEPFDFETFVANDKIINP